MIIVTGKMSSREEHLLRSKAFYLIKKWTSLTYLRSSIANYTRFLETYERGLDTPSQNQADLKNWYIHEFYPRSVDFERGLKVLASGFDRRMAYGHLVTGAKFSDYLWGMSAEYWLVEHDPFFIKMGRGGSRRGPGQTVYADPDTGLVDDCAELVARLAALQCTLNFPFSRGLTTHVNEKGVRHTYSHWTFESLFDGVRGSPYPHWPLDRNVPANAGDCPRRNERNILQIFSGDTVLLDGIYEPWMPNGTVGCPNYMLKGSAAHGYQLEGTNTLSNVRWRLLWEDARYVDGYIPPEESGYPEARSPLQFSQRLVASPGEICPKSGRWRAPRLANSIEHFNLADIMPGPKFARTGNVIWYFVEPEEKT